MKVRIAGYVGTVARFREYLAWMRNVLKSNRRGLHVWLLRSH